MAELERNYVIPLKKEMLKVPPYRRAKKAITTIRNFLKRHMKVEEIKLGDYLNREVHARGRKHPPNKVSVKVIKVEEKDNVYAKADSINAPREEMKEEKKKGLTERLKDTITGKEVKEQETKGEKEKVAEEKEKKEVLEHEKIEHKTRGKTKDESVKPQKLPAKAGIVTSSKKK